jgi:hypothetical protein
MYHCSEKGVMKQPYRPSDFDGIFYKEAALPALKIEISGSQIFFPYP